MSRCIICTQDLKVTKDNNVNRHYTSLHKAKYENYVVKTAQSFKDNKMANEFKKKSYPTKY